MRQGTRAVYVNAAAGGDQLHTLLPYEVLVECVVRAFMFLIGWVGVNATGECRSQGLPVTQIVTISIDANTSAQYRRVVRLNIFDI